LPLLPARQGSIDDNNLGTGGGTGEGAIIVCYGDKHQQSYCYEGLHDRASLFSEQWCSIAYDD
jgi:hypothetical protein